MGSPLGADGNRYQAKEMAATEGGSAVSGQGDIIHVMSSAGRAGFWQAGCTLFLQAACQKAMADNAALSAVPPGATCPDT